jgi:glycine oxidase
MSEPKPSAVDVAVVGGGAVGLAVAFEAARRGLRTAVFERDRAGHGTSHVAAGMLAPIAEAAAGEEPLLELGLRSTRLYPEFVAALAEAAPDQPSGYTKCGTLLVARDSDEAEGLERELELRRRFGLNVERLRASTARRLEPALAPALRLAALVPSDHAIDPRRLTAALAAGVKSAGGRLHEHTPVRGILRDGDRVTGLQLAGDREVRSRAVVIAAGVWSSAVEGLKDELPIRLRPVKGQIMRLHDPAGSGLLSRVVRMGSGYIVPRGDGRYVIGATSEERGFDTTVTAGAAFELLRDAGELVPGVSELVLDEFRAGLRPGTPDNLPVIGPGRAGGLHWATGHGRAGILLAPVTARLVCAGLQEQEPELDLSPFSAARFAPTGVGSPA